MNLTLIYQKDRKQWAEKAMDQLIKEGVASESAVCIYPDTGTYLIHDEEGNEETLHFRVDIINDQYEVELWADHLEKIIQDKIINSIDTYIDKNGWEERNVRNIY